MPMARIAGPRMQTALLGCHCGCQSLVQAQKLAANRLRPRILICHCHEPLIPTHDVPSSRFFTFRSGCCVDCSPTLLLAPVCGRLRALVSCLSMGKGRDPMKERAGRTRDGGKGFCRASPPRAHASPPSCHASHALSASGTAAVTREFGETEQH